MKERIKKLVNFIERAFRESIKFVERFFKEIFIALILAIIAAIVVEIYIERSGIKILNAISKTVAKIETYDKNMTPLGQGSGIFISSDGELVTNYHVIGGAQFITAKLPSGAYFKLNNVLGTNKNYDVAILKFEAHDIPFAGEGDSDKIEDGEKIFAIGNPMGLESTISEGIVSKAKRELNGMEFIQFTAPISSGSSGGGLFDSSGNVIGVTTMSLDITPELQKEALAQNLNFAVPVNLINKVRKREDARFTEESPEFYYSVGILAENKKDYDKAIEYFKKAIVLDDKYVDAYIELGSIYYQKGLWDLQQQVFETAVQLDPNNSDAHYSLATAYEDKGLYDLAIHEYRKVIELKPDDKDAHYDVGILYVISGDYNNASQEVKALLDLDPGLAGILKKLIPISKNN